MRFSQTPKILAATVALITSFTFAGCRSLDTPLPNPFSKAGTDGAACADGSCSLTLSDKAMGDHAMGSESAVAGLGDAGLGDAELGDAEPGLIKQVSAQTEKVAKKKPTSGPDVLFADFR